MKNFAFKVAVNPPNEKDIGRIKKELDEQHIYWMSKDIQDLSGLLKEA